MEFRLLHLSVKKQRRRQAEDPTASCMPRRIRAGARRASSEARRREGANWMHLDVDGMPSTSQRCAAPPLRHWQHGALACLAAVNQAGWTCCTSQPALSSYSEACRAHLRRWTSTVLISVWTSTRSVALRLPRRRTSSQWVGGGVAVQCHREDASGILVAGVLQPYVVML